MKMAFEMKYVKSVPQWERFYDHQMLEFVL